MHVAIYQAKSFLLCYSIRLNAFKELACYYTQNWRCAKYAGIVDS